MLETAATAAQVKEEWVHLSGVALVRLSQDEALAVWKARQRLLGILRIERDEQQPHVLHRLAELQFRRRYRLSLHADQGGLASF